MTRLSLFGALALSLSLAAPGLGAESPGKGSRFTKLDGQRVHYESRGTGREALVFVHGWTCNLKFWSRQVEAFAGDKRVIAVDLPGHGESDKPPVAYTMDLFARAVDAVLRDAAVDRAVLVGHSMGTPVIRQFYRKYPRKTLALVVVDGPLRPFADRKAMDDFIAPLRGPNYKEVAGAFIERMFGPGATQELRAEIKSGMLSTPQSVAVSAFEGMNDEAIWKTDRITPPVLAVMARSPTLPADTEPSYRGIAPNLTYQAWDGVGHFVMMEKPEEFNQALAAFLADHGLLKR